MMGFDLHELQACVNSSEWVLMCILANSIDITARQEDVNVVLYIWLIVLNPEVYSWLKYLSKILYHE